MVHETRTKFDSQTCSQDTSESPSSFHDELNKDCSPPVEKVDKQPIPAADKGQEKPKPENAPAPRLLEKAGEQPKPAGEQPKPGPEARSTAQESADAKPKQGTEPRPAKPVDVQPKPGTEPRPATPPKPADVQTKPVPNADKPADPSPDDRPSPPQNVPPLPRPEGGGVDPRRFPEAQQQPVPGPEVVVKKAPAHPLLPPFHDPAILNAPMDQLDQLSKMQVTNETIYKFAKGAHIEIIRRYEEAFPADQVQMTTKESIPLLLKALKEGKSLEPGPDGKMIIGNKPLSTDDRFAMHHAVCSDLYMIAQKAICKVEAASFMYKNHQYKDAEAYGLWAKSAADDIPVDLLQEESKQLKTDIALFDDPQKRERMLQVASTLSTDGKSQGADTIPILTRKMLTMLYLGTELRLDGQQVVAEFGKTVAFKPELAFEMAKETRQKTKEILGFDPLDEKQARQDPEVASLFGGICEIVGNPEKYNLYKLVDEHQLEKMKTELKSHTGMDSMLTDIGVVALTATALSVSRNPKIQAGLENMLGHVVPGAEKSAAGINKIAGLSAAAIGAPLARHYGYKSLTGLDENWSDTGVHVAGSLAAAELGGRVLGQGSMLTGRAGRGVATLQHFDKVGSAEWLSMQGYNTTGKLADLLKSSGYSKEATIFGNVPRGTALSSEAGLKAIEQANLTYSRLATVARSVTQDLRAASGIDSSKLADALSKPSGGKIATVDDIARTMEQDKQVLEGYLKNANTSKKSAPIQDSLGDHGWTPDGLRLTDAMEKLGVKNVGEAEKLHGQLKKGFADQFPRIAEMQASGLANGSTKLTDLAAMANRAFDGPGLERLLSHVPADSRTSLLTDRIIEEVATGVSKGRTKIQEAVLAHSNASSLQGVPSYFGVATPSSVARTNWSTALMAGGTVAGTYNSIVKTWDLMQLNNPETGQPYSLGEAFREAHFPTVLDQNSSAALRYTASFLLGTPGQTLAARLLLRPGAINQTGPSLNPLSRSFNNFSAGIQAIPGMSGAGALGATLWKPMLDDTGRNGAKNVKYKELLKNSQAPIENKPLPVPR